MGGQKNPGNTGGGRDHGSDRDNDRGSPGPVGGHESYGMDKDSFDKSIGGGSSRDRGGDGSGGAKGGQVGATNRATAEAFGSARRAFSRFSEAQDASPTSQQEGSLTSDIGETGAQYGRYSTPGPIGGASSYGVSEQTAETMGAPHQATSPARQEDFARDVIARGGPQTETEAQRLGDLSSGRATRQGVDLASGVVGLGSPALGAGLNLAADAAASFASPEFQAGYSSVDDGTTGKVASGLNVAGQVTGSSTIGRLASAASSFSPFADAAESQMTDRQDLYNQIGQYAGTPQTQPTRTTGADSYQTPDAMTTQTAQPSMSSQFVERSTLDFGPTNYSSYVDNYLSKYLGQRG